VSEGGAGEALPPWILKLLAKKVIFSISMGKKQISPLLAPPGKNFGKIPYCPPLEKILPTPMAINIGRFSNIVFNTVSHALTVDC